MLNKWLTCDDIEFCSFRLATVAVENIPPYVCHVLAKQLSYLSVEQIFVKGDCVPSTVISAVGDTKVNRRRLGRERTLSLRPLNKEGKGQVWASTEYPVGGEWRPISRGMFWVSWV